MRIVLVVIATITAVNVGDEEKYVKNEEAKKLRKQTIQNSTDYVALDGFDEHKSNDFETIIKDPLGPGLQRGRATVLRQAKKLNVKQITKQRTQNAAITCKCHATPPLGPLSYDIIYRTPPYNK